MLYFNMKASEKEINELDIVAWTDICGKLLLKIVIKYC